MISEYLMNGWIEYTEKKTYNTLLEFADKTFPKDGTDRLFIGCALLLINSVINKNYATTDAMLSILECGKEKIGNTNLLTIYFERRNTNKDISKYLKKELYDDDFEKHLDMLIDYYKGWIFDFKKIMYREVEDKIKYYV